jgi:hypothetical protein
MDFDSKESGGWVCEPYACGKSPVDHREAQPPSVAGGCGGVACGARPLAHAGGC